MKSDANLKKQDWAVVVVLYLILLLSPILIALFQFLFSKPHRPKKDLENKPSYLIATTRNYESKQNSPA